MVFRFFLPLVSLLLCAAGAVAQFTFDHSNYRKGAGFVTDVSGRPTDPRAYENVSDGSPWWFDIFLTADLAGQDGRLYRSIPVKVDLLADKVYYRNSAGATFELLTPVWYLHTFAPGSTDTLKLVRADYFPGAAGAGISGWLQVQLSGEATLLQQLGKTMQENKRFGSATIEYSITDRTQWVVLIDSLPVPVKKVKDLQELLARKKPGIGTYKTKQKGFEAQLKELVLIYNHM